MSPLFNLLKEDTDLRFPCELNPGVHEALQIVTDKIQTSFVSKQQAELPLRHFVIAEFQPYALIAQWCDDKQLWMLEWVFLPHTLSKIVATLPDMIARLVSTGQKLYQTLSGEDASHIHIPLPADAFQDIRICFSLSLHAAMTDFLGNIVNSSPKSKVFQCLKDLSLQLCSLALSQPLPGAKTVFIDGSGKTQKAAVAKKNSTGVWENSVIFQPGLTELIELVATVKPFQLFQNEHFNLI